MIMTEVIMDQQEHPVVRHEAILAFADLYGETEEIVKLRDDPHQIVSESALILLD